MNPRLPTVDEMHRLLTVGETTVAPAGFAELARLGLCQLNENTGQAVLTRRVLRIMNEAPDRSEAIAALFACTADLRTAWMRIVAARVREAGARRDAPELCQAISALGEASERVRRLLPAASLQPTPFGALEVELFGAAAHLAVAAPKLLRAIAATAWLMEGSNAGKRKPQAIAAVDLLAPKVSWCGGRVLQMPQKTEQAVSHVLRGDCAALGEEERVADEKPWRALMRWVLYRPWCMLLAQIVFTSEAWGAEQISGQLTLELGEDQISNPYEPNRVDVVVTTPDGSEVLCGSLGQLVVRVLERLQVALLARSEAVERLDEQLAGVIRLLLERKVWRFDPRGAGGGRPGYLIDDDFSTSCYRAFGSKYFYRAGGVLTAAIRSSAEQWTSEKQAKSRELAGVES